MTNPHRDGNIMSKERDVVQTINAYLGKSGRIDKGRRPRNPVVTIKPGDSGYDEKLQEAQEAAQRNPQRERGLGSNRPIIEPVDKSLQKLRKADNKCPHCGYNTSSKNTKCLNCGALNPDYKGPAPTDRQLANNPGRERRGVGPLELAVDKSIDIKKSMDLEEPSRSWSYQG